MAFNIKKKAQQLEDLLSRTYDQVMPFDNGLTFKQRTPTTNRSVVQQVAQSAPLRAARPVATTVSNLMTNPVGTAGSLLQQAGSRLPTFSPSSPARFANNLLINPIKTTDQNVGRILQGQNPYTGNLRQQAGQASQDAINLASFVPIGKAAGLAKAGVEQGFRQAAKSGLREGAAIGTGFGAAQGVSSALQNDNTLPQAARTIASNTVAGGVLGGATGVVAPAIGEAAGRTVNGVLKLPQKLNNAADSIEAYGIRRQLNKEAKANQASLPKDQQTYVQEQRAAQDAAREKPVPTVGQIKTNLKSKLVDQLAALEDPIRIAEKNGQDVNFLDVRDAMDRSLRSGTVAGQFLKDSGFDKLVQNSDVDTVGAYLVAKHRLDINAKTGKTAGRDIARDRELVNSVERTQPQMVEQAQRFHQYLSDLRQKMVDYQLITPETKAFLEKKYPNYVPSERIFNDLEREVRGAGQGSGRGTANLSQQNSVRKMIEEDSKRVIENPFNSVVNLTNRVFDEGERANAGRTFIDNAIKIDGNPLGIKALRTEENVKLRYSNYKKLAESRPIRDELQKQVTATRKAIVALSQRNKELGPKVLKKVTSKSAQTQVRNNALKLANNADRSAGRGKSLAKMPSEADIREAFEQYLDGNPALVKNMYEFIGNKSELAKTTAKLEKIKSDFIKVKNQRSQLFNEARAAADANTRGKSILSTYRGGVREIYEVPHEVAQAAKSLNRGQLHTVLKILQYPTRALRLGATGLNTGFALANVTKDLASAVLNSKHPLHSSIGNPRVFLDALIASGNHGSKQYGELARNAVLGTSFDIGREKSHLDLEKIRAQKNVLSKAMYSVKTPGELLRIVEDTIGRSEEFTRALQYFGNRNAEFKRTGDMEFARKFGADAARNNTVNFSRMGEYGQVLNTLIPYLNAGIQGARTFVRTVKEDPKAAATKLAILGFVPTATVTAWNINDPKRKAAYDNISQYEKDHNLIIVPPNPKQDKKTGKWNVIKIPTSQEIANLNNVVRNGVESLSKDKNFDFKGMLGDLVGSTTSIQAQSPTEAVGQFIPQAIKPTVEATQNRNLFTGQQIVPDALKNLANKDQYNQGTSITAKTVGKALNLSPLQLDNAIRTAFGGFGQQNLYISDQILSKLGKGTKDDIRGQSADDAVLGRFNQAQGQTSGSIFYNTIQQEAKKQHLAGSDYTALNALLSKELDQNGNPVGLDEQDALKNARIRAASPNIVAVEAAAAKEIAKKTGQPLDPIYNLSPQQRQTYYQLQATPYKSDDYNRLADQSKSWLQPFQQARSDFFDQLTSTGNAPKTKNNRVKFPTFDQNTQSKMDMYSKITDPTKRNDFLKANPNVQAAFNQISQYTNDRREAQGYDPFKAYPSASPQLQSAIDQYVNLSSASKSAWINANPNTYAQIQKYFADTAAYQLANNAGQAKYQGSDLNQQALKSAYSLGQYDIAKDSSGNYSINPAAASQANYSKRYGGGKSGGSRRSKKVKIPKVRVKKVRISKPRSTKVKIKKPKTVKVRAV